MKADEAASLLLEYQPDAMAMCTYWSSLDSLESDVDHLVELGFRRISNNPDLKMASWDINRLELILLRILEILDDVEFPDLQ